MQCIETLYEKCVFTFAQRQRNKMALQKIGEGERTCGGGVGRRMIVFLVKIRRLSSVIGISNILGDFRFFFK